MATNRPGDKTQRILKACRFILCVIATILMVGCSDMGTAPKPEDNDTGIGPNDGGNSEFSAELTELIPTRTIVGDTVRVIGSGLGNEQGDVVIRFSNGTAGYVTATVISWSDTEAHVLVPEGAASGAVVAAIDTSTSNALAFSPAQRLISYAADVDPVFGAVRYGCKGCHGGSGGLTMTTREELLRGDSSNGPVVVRRESDVSLLIRKLRGTAPGDRMPIGGRMDDADILTIADWIDQGARDN